jgi:Putative Flp pilus-assembly TadE/G-like
MHASFRVNGTLHPVKASLFLGTFTRRQEGQALVYGLFMLIAGLISLFFLFNTGQLTQEKTKLVNTADAVAYSAGILHARTLNYMAYTNRAMMANTVAIAQLVSLASWVRYVQSLPTHAAGSADPLKYPIFYISYMSAVYTGDALHATLIESGALDGLAQASDTLIHSALMGAQQAAYAELPIARQQVMQEVAEANYTNDGSISVDPIPLTGGNELGRFLHHYDGDERQRFAELAQIAAYRDAFVQKRSWTMPSTPIGVCPAALLQGHLDELKRRGGTNLVSLNEWKAMDTLSEWTWTAKSKFALPCSEHVENPRGWGSQSAANDPSEDLSPNHYDGSPAVNPEASAIASATSSSNSWGYQGIPSFYDLSEEMLKADDPRLRFAIRLRRKISETRSSEGRSAVRSSEHLNAYQADAAGKGGSHGDELVAVSASEVFFERPPSAKTNRYGEALETPVELPNLFNPYWQVHLIDMPDTVKAAQADQGVTLP